MADRIICLVIGYCFGLFQTSYIYGRMNGIDIREHGSGNAGTTNALRTLGKKAGAITFIGDCVKCILAVLLVTLLFGNVHPEYLRLLKLYAAAGTIIGHDFPVYLHFHGGKGIAATAGLLVSYDWRLTLIALVVFLAAFLITNYVSLGSLLVYMVFLAGNIVLGQTGAFAMTQRYLNELYLVAAILTAIAFWQHRANIVRLAKGTENKTVLFGKK